MTEKMTEQKQHIGSFKRFLSALCFWRRNDSPERKTEPVTCLTPRQFYHLFGCFNLVIIIIGIFLITAGLGSLFTSPFISTEYLNSACGRLLKAACDRVVLGYIGAISVLVGSTLYLIGRHKRRLDLKTAEYQEDVDSLLAEVEADIHAYEKKQKNPDSKLTKAIETERKKLDEKNRDKDREVSILATILLRRMQVDLYDEEKIVSQALYELLEFRDLLGNDTHYYYEHFSTQIQDNKSDPIRLRTILKNLREAFQGEKFLQGRGEAVLESVAHWGMRV